MNQANKKSGLKDIIKKGKNKIYKKIEQIGNQVENRTGIPGKIADGVDALGKSNE